MTALYETMIVLGLFLLRLGTPLAIIVLVTYWLNRLDARWAAEASAYQRAQHWQANPTLVQTAQPPLTPPCWVQRACPADKQTRCAAGQQPGLPCWLARMRQEGRLPTGCTHCAIFALPIAALPANVSPAPNAGDD